MSSIPEHPLVFNCVNCHKESTYPSYLQEGDSPDEACTVVKRCTNCGKENKIEIPAGYHAGEMDSVLRGYTPK